VSMTAFGAVLGFRSQALFFDLMVLKADQALLDVVATKDVPRHCVSEPCTGSCPYQ